MCRKKDPLMKLFKNNKYNLQHMAKKISTLSAYAVFSFGGLVDHSHESLQYREAVSDFMPTLGWFNMNTSRNKFN